MTRRHKNNEQSPTFTKHEEVSLKLLQSLLHHANLKVPAPSTTKQRISKLKELQEVSPDLERQLENASTVVVGWLWKNKAALYASVKKVLNKNSQMLSSGFYDVDELANILFLESLRILYNYKWGSEAQPLTYLISILNRRKHVLLAMEVPYANDFDCFLEDVNDSW